MSSLFSVFQFMAEIVTLLGAVAATYIGLSVKTAVSAVKLEQAAVKSALMEAQNHDRLTFFGKLSEIERDFAVHTKEDEMTFKVMSDTLSRIEIRLNSHPGVSPDNRM